MRHYTVYGTQLVAKVLALGLYRLAHGNSYSTIAPVFNVGKATVIEAVQDVVNGLYEIRNDHIKFPETLAEVTTSIETFENLTDVPNVVGAIGGLHIRIKAPVYSALDYSSWYRPVFIIQARRQWKEAFSGICLWISSLYAPQSRSKTKPNIYKSRPQRILNHSNRKHRWPRDRTISGWR